MAHIRKSFTILLLSLLLFMQGQVWGAPRKAPSIRYVSLKSVTYLYMEDVARFYGMRYKTDGKKVILFSAYSNIEMKLDSRVMTLNGIQVHLSRPIIKSGGRLLLGKSDFQNILEPVLRTKTLKRRKVKNIMIDPGHGGKDVGAVSGKIYEKNINLQVAQRLSQKLRARGYRVIMTRTKDVNLSLEARADFATKYKPDAFISLHCNSASSSVTGTEIYIATPSGDPPTGDNHVSKKACPANSYNAENAFLAYYAQRAILARTGFEDRGVRRRRFYVVRNVPAPCMLVEMGFISNDSELLRLRSPYTQEQIANALADTIVKYRDVTR